MLETVQVWPIGQPVWLARRTIRQPDSILGWIFGRPRENLAGQRPQTMEWTADNQPSTFFAVCARLIGPEVKLTIEQSLPGNLSAEDWAMMGEIVEAVKQAIPDASSQPPGAVLQHVLAKLRD